MVLIKVLLAEVRLDDVFEIGGEVGLQDSLLYDRGIAAGAFPGATPPSIDPTSNPGFNFNNFGTNNLGLPNANSFGQGNLAARGVSSFGVGTSNSTLGYGGFVLSAASDSISLLLRTLQEAERLQILSRPQIMTMDNTEGFVQVGRLIARVTDVINNGVAGTQVVTEDVEVGLIMNVRPRVGSDGLIIMDVDATRSDRDNNNGTLVPAGDGEVVFIADILRTTAQSVVAAYSGQTVIFGGLIQKTRFNSSKRVPIVADIPLLGHLFKYDQELETRTELLVVLTPMLVTGEEDLDYVKEVESRRMSWCLADVVEAHGDVGLSGGNGLWGPAVGGTIYPDLQPTVEDVVIRDSYRVGGSPVVGSEVIISDEPVTVPDNSIDSFAPPLAQPPMSPTPLNSSPMNSSPSDVLPLDQPLYQRLPSDVPQATDGAATPQQQRPSGLPVPVSIPQASMVAPRIPNVANGQPSPTGSAQGIKARQASWIEALKASRSQPQAPPPAVNPASRQKPMRLGVNDELLTSD